MHITEGYVMDAEVRMLPAKRGWRAISLTIPASKAAVVFDAIRGIFPMAGLKVRHINEEGEKLFTSAEVFPEGSPAMVLRGLRVKEDITQAELATRLSISQNMVSDMESGKRNISLKMARRIAEAFNVPYRAFL
jgi:DNA-binding XRE family transcriptional regulator